MLTLREFLPWRTNPQIRTHFLQAPFADTFNREKVVNFLKGATFLTEIYDGFCGAGADSGHLLQLVCRREIQIDECAGGVRLVSAQTCVEKNKSRKKERAINLQDEIRPRTVRGESGVERTRTHTFSALAELRTALRRAREMKSSRTVFVRHDFHAGRTP